MNINIAECYNRWYTYGDENFDDKLQKDLFYLCASIVTSKKEEFKRIIDKVDVSQSVKDVVEEVYDTMNKDEELKIRYYNLIEEEERIQRSANELAIQRAEEKGIEEGIKEGTKIGIKDAKKTVVLNMHKDNISVDTIAKYVNLTTNEVEKIIKKL